MRCKPDHAPQTGRAEGEPRPPGVSPDPWTRTKSAAYRRTLAQVERLARSPTAPILLEGESGTGKTTIARHIHNCSPRTGHPFVPVLLNALDDGLIAATLFGHTPGAFTGAQGARAGAFASARGGTLFLDEIGKASLHAQQYLLHAIETREFTPVGADRPLQADVRVVIATNVPLARLVEEKHFLPDLHARIEAFRIRIPPLRERRADIAFLATETVRMRAVDAGYGAPPMIGSDLMSALQQAPWPNNIRELDTTLHRILLNAAGADPLTLDHCRDTFEDIRGLVVHRRPITPQSVYAALDEAGTVKGAALLLQVDRSTVHRYLRNGSRRNTAARVGDETGGPA